MTQAFSPTEIFKRATASTLRAIAERDDLTVGFGPEPAGVTGTRVKLPNPARDLPADEAAQLRGAADSLALRLRYHDDALHSKRVPGNALARAVFEGLEQARVEALGSRRMVGVAANLGAMLDEQYRRQGFERITERTESTMAEAVRLLTREALTREPPPPSARRVVDLWRPWLEGKIGKDIAELDRTVRDQDGYARATRRLIQDLDIDLGEIDDSSSDDNQGQGEETDSDNQADSGESATSGAQPSMDGSPADSADAPRRRQPGPAARLQARARDRVPRHRRVAIDRQFWLDARPADHRGGDERRHPRPHPGALRRQGRDPRLHDPGLEGRAGARALDRCRQAAQPRPAQRSAPHRLQAGGCAVAARPAQSRPDAARRHPEGEYRRRGPGLGA